MVRGASTALVIVDLPFGSYQESPAQAFRSAARIMAETAAPASSWRAARPWPRPLPSWSSVASRCSGMSACSRSRCNVYGGYGARGKAEAEAVRIVADARAVADAGAFAMVVEGVVEPLAQRDHRAVAVPTIGIGASAACDGQILVCDDVLGLFGDFMPRFVKQYADLARHRRCGHPGLRGRRPRPPLSGARPSLSRRPGAGASEPL